MHHVIIVLLLILRKSSIFFKISKGRAKVGEKLVRVSEMKIPFLTRNLKTFPSLWTKQRWWKFCPLIVVPRTRKVSSVSCQLCPLSFRHSNIDVWKAPALVLIKFFLAKNRRLFIGGISQGWWCGEHRVLIANRWNVSRMSFFKYGNCWELVLGSYQCTDMGGHFSVCLPWFSGIFLSHAIFSLFLISSEYHRFYQNKIQQKTYSFTFFLQSHTKNACGSLLACFYQFLLLVCCES